MAKTEDYEAVIGKEMGWKWGTVREVGTVKEFAAVLGDEGGEEAIEWWRMKMGFGGDSS
jgi:hypothetical protein